MIEFFSSMSVANLLEAETSLGAVLKVSLSCSCLNSAVAKLETDKVCSVSLDLLRTNFIFLDSTGASVTSSRFYYLSVLAFRIAFIE